jgi:CheY-like chemotaxis protein
MTAHLTPDGAPAPVPDPSAGPRGLGPLVLVVDDEPSIAALLAAVLRRAGLRPLTAGNGVEALRMAREFRAELRLVLTELALPLLDGPTLIAALHQLAPGVPVAVVSSYREEGRALLERRAVRDVLPKPFRPEQLLALAKRLLAGG